MKTWLKFFAAAAMLAALNGCDKSPNLAAVDPKWDRDVCERCRMLLSDKYFSAEVVNPEDGRHYFFDDLGCAFNWLNEEKNKSWASKAIIYANDAKTGEWLDISRHFLATGYVTPMSYGIGVFKDKKDIEEGKKMISPEEAREISVEKLKEKMQKKAAQKEGSVQGPGH